MNNNEIFDFFSTMSKEVLSREGITFFCILQNKGETDRKIISNLTPEGQKNMIEDVAILFNLKHNEPVKIQFD